jgi:phosphohistidine phosphatase
MKSLIIARHAKSSWDLSTPNDFDRTLNDRGKKDAPAAAKRLFKKGIKIDAFISSPAVRAKKTAKYFMEEYGRDKSELILIPELYEAPTSVFFDVIRNLNDAYQHVIIFAHNPAVTAFVNTLTDVQIDNIPTTGLFGVQSQINEWKDFRDAPREFWFFDYPKLHT